MATDEMEKNSEAGEQLALLRLVADKAPGMLAYWNADQRCLYANAAYECWFGIKPESLVGMTLKELLGPIYPLNLPHIEGVLRGQAQQFEREIPDPRGGPARYSQAHYVPDIRRGLVQGFVVMASDVTARRDLERKLLAAHERLESMATHDALTGLPNRVLIEDRIGRAIEHSKRYQHRSGILFLDLDGFKEVNDTLGHAAGDALLRDVAQRLQVSLRSSDTVARFGGDEFIALLPEVASRDQTAAVAEKVLASIASRPFLIEDHVVTISLSIGVAVLPDDGVTFQGLLERADSALYQAKQSGKNRISHVGR
jgi:diguanylate cyclase (GGDEF)-like protein/PAS domain S-box-containing protein